MKNSTRLIGWLAGLVIIASAAVLYRPLAEFDLVMWLSLGIAAGVLSILVWMSAVVDRVVAPEKGDSRGVFTFFISLAFFAMGAVFVVGVHGEWVEKNWGTFGDFLGGVLNPILTFLSFMALLFTIILQQREIHGAKQDAKDLQVQRREDRLSNERMQFESTFFQMISIHNTIVNSIDVDRGRSKNQLKGRECFKYFRDEKRMFYNADPSTDERKKSLAAHDHIWKSYQNDLGDNHL